MGIFSIGTIIVVETLIGVEFGLHHRFCSTNFNVYAEFEANSKVYVHVCARVWERSDVERTNQFSSL